MLQGLSNRTIMSKTNPLCNRPYENRYGTIRSGGIGGQFNFEGLKSNLSGLGALMKRGIDTTDG